MADITLDERVKRAVIQELDRQGEVIDGCFVDVDALVKAVVAALPPTAVGGVETELRVSAERLSQTAQKPAPSNPPAQAWQDIATAPKDGTRILFAKIVGHPDHDTALWWVVAGHWSHKWGNWNDGVEPSGLAGPTHWLPISAYGVGTPAQGRSE